MNVFVIDVAKCNGCYNCQIACKDEHCGTSWEPFTKPQPQTGQYWARIEEKVRGSVPVVKLSYTPVMCNHCDEAPCMAVATDGAVYRRDDGMVIIDPDKAVGQKQIVDACPIGAVYWNEELSLPQKCTGCAHLLDAGWTAPRCVDACATGALRFGPKEDFADELAAAETLEAVSAYGPHVFYLHMPKRFVAGAVIDFDADEVVIGAKVEVRDAQGSLVRADETDDMGDFYIDGLEPGAYSVSIGMDGYREIVVAADVSEADVNFGDMAFTKR